MSRFNTLIRLRKMYGGWDITVNKLFGGNYEKAPIFRDHVFAYNNGTNPESLAEGFDRYLFQGGLCLD